MQEKNREQIIEIIETYKGEGLIAVLQKIQKVFKYLPPPVIPIVSSSMKVPISRIYGVATFYPYFSLKPRGRYLIRVCNGTTCHVKGQDEILTRIKRLTGIKEGETSPDFLFTLEIVACIGACALAPVMVVNNEYFGKMNLHKAELIINHYKAIKRAEEMQNGKDNITE